MQLTGIELGEVRVAFEKAFDIFTFPLFLGERLNKDPYKLGAPLIGDLSAMIRAVAIRANLEGWIGELLLNAREALPANEYLAALTEKRGLSATHKQALEDVIRKDIDYLDIRFFITKLTTLEYQVCRIEVPTDQGDTLYGTGFLIAADLLMTNYHVVEAVDLGEQGKTTAKGYSSKAANVRCRFDYKRVNNDEINKGNVFRLANNWKYNLSLYDPPGPKNLDYAILRLEGAPGDGPIATTPGNFGEKHGFITLPDADYPFTKGSPLWIQQHPAALPLKLALDSAGVIGVNVDWSRVTYTTNTEGGSSGAPCFNQHLYPVALHHAGDPNYPNIGPANEGIPLSTIRKLLSERGLEGGLV